MDYCQNCGHKLNPGQRFCPECGTVQKEVVSNEQPENSPVQSRSQQSNKQMKPIFKSKGSKILVGMIVAVIVILFGTYKYIGSTLTAEKVAAQFADAVKTQNVKEMEEILNHNRPELNINDDSVVAFIAYFKKHPDVFSDTIKNLNNDVTHLYLSKNYLNSKDPVSIVRDGKKWLLFDHYAVNPQLYYLDVTSNRNNTEISINGKSVGKVSSAKRTFGPFLLSDFTIKGTYKAQYTPVYDTKSFNPIEEDSQHLQADLDLTGNTVMVTSDEGNAILYVNGKSTGKKLQDIDTFGPVPVDGSMKLQAVLKEGSKTTKSNQETITSADQAVDLTFPDSTSVSSLDVPMDSSYPSETDVRQVVYDHYSYISDGDYMAAYDLFSPRRRAKDKFSHWSNGMKKNYHNEPDVSNVQFTDDTHAVADFTLTSRDRESDGTTTVKEFGGTWSLVYENGQWLLDGSKIKQVDSYTE